ERIGVGVGLGVGVGRGSCVGVGVGVGVGGGGVGVGVGLFTTIAAPIPTAAAPASSAMVPAVSARPPAAKPAGEIEAPVAAENTCTGPAGPIAAIFLSGHSRASATTLPWISAVCASPNSVVVAWM